MLHNVKPDREKPLVIIEQRGQTAEVVVHFKKVQSRKTDINNRNQDLGFKVKLKTSMFLLDAAI